MDKKSPWRIAVIGGGLAGLSAAHRLMEIGKERSRPFDVTIFEAASRLGGVVGTEQIGGYLVDVGADSFLTNKPGAVSLCKRLGIEDRLVPTDPRYRGAFVLYDGRPVPVPEGFQLLSPTAIWPVVTSPLFSVWGKLRLLAEWFVPRKSHIANPSARVTSSESTFHAGLIDESVAEFARRRFGREALDRLIQPLVGGIYTSDPEKLSLAATMPRFLEMERDYGSLIRASLFPSPGKIGGDMDPAANRADASSGARYGLFAGLAGGMKDLVDALQKSVEASCHIRSNCSVVSITQCIVTSPQSDLESSDSRYRLSLADGTQERFDAVIVATTASQAANLLQTVNPLIGDELRAIEYASSALVVTGHRIEQIRHPLNAFGLVIPHRENRRILAVSFSSRKFPNRAPDNRVLLRTFVGGALQPELFEQSDQQMIETVLEELDDIFGVRGTPDFARVYRYQQAMPQYYVGHLDRVVRIEALTRQYPNLSLAGCAFRGVGIPDVISSGERAAESIITDPPS